MEKEIKVWQPIEFNRRWLEVDTSMLDSIAPSWFRKREQISTDSKSFEGFLNRLKREHAIETGIIEKLYDLKEGITETFIQKGFIESYLQHGDTNIPANQLFAYLRDHQEAIDFVFDVVKRERPITKGFILELHQLITRHQDTVDAVDSLGKTVQVKLLKGEFKKHENNPKRADGSVFLYCPPIHVDSEMEKLLSIYSDLEAKSVKPIILAAWFHHAFTQIHPFQDGNGRMARLLASLILIRHGLFPFTVKRNERAEYIKSLELADKNEPQSLVTFFCEVQRRNIYAVLNLKHDDHTIDKPFIQVLNIFKQKAEIGKQRDLNQIHQKREEIFKFCEETMNKIVQEIKNGISSDLVQIDFKFCPPGKEKYYYFTRQIVDYANHHNYYFNRTLPRGWFKISFIFSKEKQYQLVITLHHYGYDTSTIAIGAFLEYVETKTDGKDKATKRSRKGRNNQLITSLPLEIKPFIMSLGAETQDFEILLKSFLEDIVTITLGHIANEMG